MTSPFRLVVVALLCACACGGPPPAARRAQRYLAAGEFAAAERIADTELARSPREPHLWRVRIQASLRRGDPARAIEHYRAWRQLRGADDPDALRTMAVTTLWRALRVPSAAIRTRAVQIAERLDLSPLADAVAELMLDEDPAVAAAAAIAVLRYHPDAPMMAVRALSSDRPEARAIAVEGIGRKVGEPARDDLLPRLADRAPEVRRAAIAAIAPLASRAERDRFATMATDDPEGSVRAAALRALARVGHPDAATLASRAEHDEFLGTRLAAVELLVRRGGDGARDALIVLAAGDDPFVALRAAVALADRGMPDRPTEVAATALEAQTWAVRAAALNALARVAGERGLALVRAGLNDPAIHVRLAAARALLRLGHRDEAAQVFVDTLDAPEPDARLQAAIDLARLHDTRGESALDELAASAETAALRSAAVRAAALTGHPTAGMVTALGDASAEPRLDAADVLLTLLDD